VTDQLTVETAHGPVRGGNAGDVDVWKGVRFAAPPTGERRWRHAAEPEPWTAVADADRYGHVCPQPTMPVIDLGPDTTTDEDCLFLNVWTPAGAAGSDARLPVLVWVHGGAYLCGSGSQPLYDGASLVRRSVAGGVPAVIVTVNYRMGVFGFADLTGLGEDYQANCGLSDVLAALRWVQANIERFGGDPATVTLFGESAGAGVVTTLLTSPAARGLFHRAVAQSSPASSVYEHDRADRHARLLLDRLDVGGDPGRLHDLDPRPLVAASGGVFNEVPERFPGTIAFAPVVDGDLVPIDPMDAFSAGLALDVPLLIGTNRDETSLFRWMRSPLMPVSESQVEAMFAMIAQEQPELAIPERHVMHAAYPRERRRRRSMGISRDLGFRLPTVWIAQAHSRRAPVYLYRFDWATPFFRALRIGATHATELPYVWGNPASATRDLSYKLGGRRTGERLTARMQQRWLNFAAHGDPAADSGHARWQPYTDQRRHSLRIGARDSAVTGLDDPLLDAFGHDVLAFG